MPNCFSLTRKGEQSPSNLVDVDEEMCKHFNVPVDKDEWYLNWHNNIGFSLAMGQSFDQLEHRYTEAMHDPKYDQRDREHSRQLLNVVEWLRDNYTSDAWSEIGRR